MRSQVRIALGSPACKDKRASAATFAPLVIGNAHCGTCFGKLALADRGRLDRAMRADGMVAAPAASLPMSHPSASSASAESITY